ncbi:hypothetical protein GGR52DRAFT_143988 [Hypoxylon sp. FL1284]|nr:hypothetical protein GGR52DRAFT_143988 [Hypoxylon sp. FL1284]
MPSSLFIIGLHRSCRAVRLCRLSPANGVPATWHAFPFSRNANPGKAVTEPIPASGPAHATFILFYFSCFLEQLLPTIPLSRPSPSDRRQASYMPPNNTAQYFDDNQLLG